MKNQSPAAPSAATPVYLGSFGGVSQLRFTNGGAARVALNRGEINRLLEALPRAVLRWERRPPPKVLAALETLQAYFHSARGHDLHIILDVPIAREAVYLTPMQYEVRADGPYETPLPLRHAATKIDALPNH